MIFDTKMFLHSFILSGKPPCPPLPPSPPLPPRHRFPFASDPSCRLHSRNFRNLLPISFPLPILSEDRLAAEDCETMDKERRNRLLSSGANPPWFMSFAFVRAVLPLAPVRKKIPRSSSKRWNFIDYHWKFLPRERKQIHTRRLRSSFSRKIHPQSGWHSIFGWSLPAAHKCAFCWPAGPAFVTFPWKGRSEQTRFLICFFILLRLICCVFFYCTGVFAYRCNLSLWTLSARGAKGIK